MIINLLAENFSQPNTSCWIASVVTLIAPGFLESFTPEEVTAELYWGPVNPQGEIAGGAMCDVEPGFLLEKSCLSLSNPGNS